MIVYERPTSDCSSTRFLTVVAESQPPMNAPHDKTFKKVFENKQIVKDIIQVNLPKEVISQFDLSTLHPVDSSFVSKNLRESFTDVLYRVKYNHLPIYVAFLFEHKSAPDKYASVQVGRYVFDVWKRSLQKSNHLPVVLPILFYHGIRRWNYPTDLREYIQGYEQLPTMLKASIPTFTYKLIDLNVQDEEFIVQYGALTRMVLTPFKYIFAELDTLLKLFILAASKLNKSVSEEEKLYYIELMLMYIAAAKRDFTEEALQRNMNELEGKGEVVMNIVEKWEQRGIEKGIEKGKREGEEKTKRENAKKLLRLGVDIKTVAEGVSLSLEQLIKIKEQMEKE